MTEDDPSTCSDGVDNDQDGLVDCADPDCYSGESLVREVSVDQHSVCDGQAGAISVIVHGGDLANYNICFGDRCVDRVTGVLNGLGAGSYDMTVTTPQGCEVTYTVSEEICGNGKDDDGDGYAECEDLDCILLQLNNLKENPQKSFTVCTPFDEDLLNEIVSLRSNQSFFNICSAQDDIDFMISQALNDCEADCSVDDLYEALNSRFDIIVDVDPDFVSCRRLYCVWQKIKAHSLSTDPSNAENRPTLCNLMTDLIENPRVGVWFEMEDDDGSDDIVGNELDDNTAGRSFPNVPIEGATTIYFNINRCESTKHSVEIAGTFIHESIHAEIFQALYRSIDPDPGINKPLEEIWSEWVEENYGGNLQTHHELMAKVHVERIASILWELNDKVGTEEDYLIIAWRGMEGYQSLYYPSQEELVIMEQNFINNVQPITTSLSCP